MKGITGVRKNSFRRLHVRPPQRENSRSSNSFRREYCPRLFSPVSSSFQRGGGCLRDRKSGRFLFLLSFFLSFYVKRNFEKSKRERFYIRNVVLGIIGLEFWKCSLLLANSFIFESSNKYVYLWKLSLYNFWIKLTGYSIPVVGIRYHLWNSNSMENDEPSMYERMYLYIFLFVIAYTTRIYTRRISAQRDNRPRVSALRVAKHVAHFSTFNR